MAENNTTETDIFQQQKKTIDTLINVLEQQPTTVPQYVYAAAPAEPKKAPNYLMWIVIGILGFLVLRGL